MFDTVGEGKVIRKAAFPTLRHITIAEDPKKLQDRLDEAMHHALNNQLNVLMNSMQNVLAVVKCKI